MYLKFLCFSISFSLPLTQVFDLFAIITMGMYLQGRSSVCSDQLGKNRPN